MNSQRQEEAVRKLYIPLPTASSIRVLKLFPISVKDSSQLRVTLHLTDLENDFLKFSSLSYTWGDPMFHAWHEKRSATFSRDISISCNDIQFKISDNLEEALRVISNQFFENETFRHCTPYLWVDSLCINQADTAERNSQVRLMSQIYQKACSVISWLGPADEHSNIAIPLIRRLLTMISSAQLPGVDGDDHLTTFAKAIDKDTLSIPDDHYKSLARFYARQYFFRCWVFQEIVLARSLRLLCGQEEVQFEHLFQIAKVITFIKSYRLEESIGQVISLPMSINRGYMIEQVVMDLHHYREEVSMSREHSGTSVLEFPQLLLFARQLGCADPRDHVYAILGLVSRGTLDIEPNYNKSVEEVHGEAIRYWIKQTRNLNILSWVTDKSRRRSPLAPSWVGELGLLRAINQQELPVMHITFCATGSSPALPVELKPIDFRVLTVRGKKIDHIVELAEPWAWHGLGIGFDPLWTSMTLKLPVLYSTGQARGEVLIRTMVAEQVGGKWMDSISDMDAFKAVVRRDTCFALNRQLHRLCWFSKEMSKMDYESRALKILQELGTLASEDDSGFIPSFQEVRGMQQVTCSCPYDLTDPSRHFSSETTAEHDQQPPPPPNRACLYMTELQRDADYFATPAPLPDSPDLHSTHKWNTDFSGSANHVMYLRKMGRTENGYLGLVPDSSEIGDAVWLLAGATVPYILRPAALQGKPGNDNRRERWELVGEAYIHGAMRGEVWDKIQGDRFEDIDLV